MVIALCTAMGLVYREGRARGRLGVEPVPSHCSGCCCTRR